MIFGIGLALFLEWRYGQTIRGLGLAGAIAINLCGGGALLLWLTRNGLSLPRQGLILLWLVDILVLGIGILELVSGSSDEDGADQPAAQPPPGETAAAAEQTKAASPTPQAQSEEDHTKAVDRARRRLEVTLYTGRSCPDCDKARRWLRDNRIRFRSRNVDSSESAKRELLEKNPGGTVPTVVIDEEVVVGFSEAGLKGRIEWAAMMRAREQ